ncbi:MAG TPA: hypothetical protein VEA19_04165 [Actinomycetota bacterium]|nr:hypothetical protein [Actinomycetota bacterium]
MRRYQLPPDLTPEEERAVIAALEKAFRAPRRRLSPWALAGRTQNLGYGRLQVRRDTDSAWTIRGRTPFTREGTPTLHGRGDAR